MKQITRFLPFLLLFLGFCLLPASAQAAATCPSFAPVMSGSFWENYESAEYVNGFLTLHFKIATPSINPFSFKERFGFLNDGCVQSPRDDESQSRDILVPGGTRNLSVRFNSLTHYDLWNDDTDAPVDCANCSRDIPGVPGYTSVFLITSTDFSSRISSAYTILENATAPPTHIGGLAPNLSCPSFSVTGNYFDNYSFAEYQNGFLNYHLRLSGPFFDSRSWNDTLNLYDENCVFIRNITIAPFGFESFASNLTGYARYFSFRFTSPTHFDVWNDETNTKEICSTCSIDINLGVLPPSSPLVQFVGSQNISGSISTFNTHPFPIEEPSQTFLEPVIIVPGILGSAQKNGVWVIDPIRHTYDNLISTLKANGYTEGENLFTFPYDWHLSNALTAIRLKDKIDEVKQICNCGKVNLVAHSMGGLVVRQYVESERYQNDISKIVFLGTPHLGAPKSYLTWEAGALDILGLEDSILEFFLTREAEKAGYVSLFNYVRDYPVSSVRELLPVYSYLKDKTSQNIKNYPDEYPRNLFLENLNNNITTLFNSGISLSNIVGDTRSGRTLSTIRVIPPGTPLLWGNGYPDGYDGSTPDRGLERGEGDDTVPLISAQGGFASSTVLFSSHSTLPENAEGLVFKNLTGRDAGTLVHNTNFVDVPLLIIKILSPADIMVVAPNGERIGKNFQTGEEFQEIPGAFYSGYGTDDEYVTIPQPLGGIYTIETQGTGNGGEYTLVAGYLDASTSTEKEFSGQTQLGLVTSAEVSIDNEHPEDMGIAPTDTVPPKIIITSPVNKEYTRSENFSVVATADDVDSGVFSLEISLDGESVENGSSTDLFFYKLGVHLLSATATDFQNNQTSSSTSFRIVATVDSTISDINRAFALGWIVNKKSKDALLDSLNKAVKLERILAYLTEQLPNTPRVVKKIERVEKRIDKILGKNFLRELDKQRGKTLKEQGYQLLLEDIRWLLDN